MGCARPFRRPAGSALAADRSPGRYLILFGGDADLEADGKNETRAPVGVSRVAEDELVQVHAAVLDLLPHARHDGTDQSDDPP